MSAEVHHIGKQYKLQVEIDPGGFICIRTYVDDLVAQELPRMTSQEANELAKHLRKAAQSVNHS